MPRDPHVGYVLHFSDVHYDDLYVIGGIADCPDPLCCRNVSENGTLVRAGDFTIGERERKKSTAIFSILMQFCSVARGKVGQLSLRHPQRHA